MSARSFIFYFLYCLFRINPLKRETGIENFQFFTKQRRISQYFWRWFNGYCCIYIYRWRSTWIYNYTRVYCIVLRFTPLGGPGGGAWKIFHDFWKKEKLDIIKCNFLFFLILISQKLLDRGGERGCRIFHTYFFVS